MSRLIDADALLKELHIEDGGTPLIAYQTHFLYKKINEQPTAYNVDAIVAELEESKKDMARNTMLIDYFKMGYRRAINEAIEIVRKGGVNNE